MNAQLALYNKGMKIKKEKKEIQNEVKKAVLNLYNKIYQYYRNGIPFDMIFNDDHVKYDKQGDFYIYKHIGKQRTQLRFLYTCFVYDDNIMIIIVDYFIKKLDNNEYIKKFNKEASKIQLPKNIVDVIDYEVISS